MCVYVVLYCEQFKDGVVVYFIEVWEGDWLVGGLYGVVIGGVFLGESMFFLEPNVSKVVLVGLVDRMCQFGMELFDC